MMPSHNLVSSFRRRRIRRLREARLYFLSSGHKARDTPLSVLKQEDNSKNDELLEKNDTKPDGIREELQKSDLQSKPHPNVVQLQTKAGENSLHSELGTQSDRKPTVKEYEECVTVPVVQIPDSSREFVVTQDAKNMGSLGTTQTTNSLPRRSPETVITIVNDDASISATNSSVIIVNISTGQKKRDNVNNANNNSSKSADDSEVGLPLVNKVTGTEVPSESLAMKTTSLSDGIRTVDRIHSTEAKTPMAIYIDSASSAATTNRSSASVNTEEQGVRTVFSKKCGEDEDNATSSKINSKGCSDSVLIERNSEGENNLISKSEKSQNVILEQNLGTKLRESPKQKTNLEANQSDMQVWDTSKNNSKLSEVSRNIKEPKLLSVERSEFEHVSNNFEYDKENDSAKNSQSSHISVDSEHKYRSKDVRRTSHIVSNSGKTQESSTIDKNSDNKKRVTLVAPPVVDMDLETESEKAELFSDSEGQLSSPKQTAKTTASAIPTEVPNLQQKYQSESETSFEADFTPRDGRMQGNSTPMNSLRKTKIDLDLNTDICGLPTQNSYDPDFKEYDFI
ncbi:doublecortin family protein [Loa loa]|uniref:Doublecortin family protein n=1 Tax=Loa loa TaxID=7209 RepID=A0A1S0UJK2_LOALO|nr:doublecortin family protein [Loa loa]EJD75870.1 doublecortin family protein [Loa loa]